MNPLPLFLALATLPSIAYGAAAKPEKADPSKPGAIVYALVMKNDKNRYFIGLGERHFGHETNTLKEQVATVVQKISERASKSTPVNGLFELRPEWAADPKMRNGASPLEAIYDALISTKNPHLELQAFDERPVTLQAFAIGQNGEWLNTTKRTLVENFNKFVQSKMPKLPSAAHYIALVGPFIRDIPTQFKLLLTMFSSPNETVAQLIARIKSNAMHETITTHAARGLMKDTGNAVLFHSAVPLIVNKNADAVVLVGKHHIEFIQQLLCDYHNFTVVKTYGTPKDNSPPLTQSQLSEALSFASTAVAASAATAAQTATTETNAKAAENNTAAHKK